MRNSGFRRNMGADTRRDHYAEVTDQIIAALEAGTPPWRQPWDNAKAGGPMMPHNATTGARYRGINVLTLAMSPLAFVTSDPRWVTYKQASERGWQVRKGSRGTTAFFYKRLEIQDRDGGNEDGGEIAKWIPLLRAFTLFHASQIDGIPPYLPPSVEDAPWRAPDAAEIIAKNSRATIRIGGERAFYSPGTDHVQMPPQVAFRSPASWASVQLHELSHWTGNSARLDRDLTGSFGSECYSREELRAEIAQMMLCAELGIADCEFTNGAAYIASWLRKLRDDKKEVFRAASDAQRIADYLLAFHPDWVDRNGRDTVPQQNRPAPTTSEDDLAEAA
jgi:antirestriction protein ArdC